MLLRFFHRLCRCCFGFLSQFFFPEIVGAGDRLLCRLCVYAWWWEGYRPSSLRRSFVPISMLHSHVLASFFLVLGAEGSVEVRVTEPLTVFSHVYTHFFVGGPLIYGNGDSRDSHLRRTKPPNGVVNGGNIAQNMFCGSCTPLLSRSSSCVAGELNRGTLVDLFLVFVFDVPDRCREMVLLSSCVEYFDAADWQVLWGQILVEESPLSYACVREVEFFLHPPVDFAALNNNDSVWQRAQGFDDGVDTVWLPSSPGGMHQTIKRLYNEEGKSRKLYIAGHSLGGALATNAAARLVFVDDMNIAAMYTIGSPM